MVKRRKSSSKAAVPSLPENREVVRIKVTSMGEGGVGKSCLIKRYCEGRFVSRYIATIGVDFGVKPVDIGDYEVRVNFWDLSGHPEFFDVRNEFYKDTQAAMLVFDVTSKKSFESLDSWYREARFFSKFLDLSYQVASTGKPGFFENPGFPVPDCWYGGASIYLEKG